MPRSPSNSRSRSPAKRRRASASPEVEKASSPTKVPVSPTLIQKGCPFLIRLFVTKGRHTPMIEFEEGRLPVQDEFTAYGWKHSTPSSLIQLLLPSFPALYRSPFARYSFRHIYVDASSRGLYRMKELVSFTGRDMMDSIASSSAGTDSKTDKTGEGRSGLNMEMELDDVPSRDRRESRGSIHEKTLGGYGFETGDLLSVSLNIPEPRGALRRPTMGGPGGPSTTMGGPGPGPGVERGSFGWNNGVGGGPGIANGGPGAGPGTAGQADRTGAWERGAPLPDQSSARPGEGRPGFAGLGNGAAEGKEGGAPNGKWGRGGGQLGAPRGGALGMRGQGRRSRSPDYTAGGRRDGGADERGGRGGRSRSPDTRRERGGR